MDTEEIKDKGKDKDSDEGRGKDTAKDRDKAEKTHRLSVRLPGVGWILYLVRLDKEPPSYCCRIRTSNKKPPSWQP